MLRNKPDSILDPKYAPKEGWIWEHSDHLDQNDLSILFKHWMAEQAEGRPAFQYKEPSITRAMKAEIRKAQQRDRKAALRSTKSKGARGKVQNRVVGQRQRKRQTRKTQISDTESDPDDEFLSGEFCSP
jgi:hypothetical protein